MDLRDLIRTERRPTYGVAAFVVLCVLWFAFVGGRRVPILGFVDLAVHEAGHVLFLWAPRDLMLVMGNGFQALVPLVFAGAFVLKHRDLAGGAASLAWCAASLQDASVYIADAPYRRLPLLGPETSHDWWQLLGRHGWLDAADELAGVVWSVGLIAWLLAVAVLGIGLRWDREWLDGSEGALYLPWDREQADGQPTSSTVRRAPLATTTTTEIQESPVPSTPPPPPDGPPGTPPAPRPTAPPAAPPGPTPAAPPGPTPADPPAPAPVAPPTSPPRRGGGPVPPSPPPPSRREGGGRVPASPPPPPSWRTDREVLDDDYGVHDPYLRPPTG